MKRSTTARVVTVALATAVTLSGCGAVKDQLGVDNNGPDAISKDDPRVTELNERAKSYWSSLADGEATEAFRFLSRRCQDERMETSQSLLASYEQRQINKMAFLRKSSSEIIDSMTTSIDSINSANNRATVSMESSLEGISMTDMEWTRSDVDNKWYLNSCRPPFGSSNEDQSSYRLERERDSEAYRDGLIEDNGNYSTPATESSSGDSDDTAGY